MSTDQDLKTAIAALERQRATLGDAVVDAAVAAMRVQMTAGEESSSQVLRQVSILFLDIVGSTTLAERLEPEEVSTVLDGTLARGAAIVERHEGRVLQFAGDNILAAFGVEATQEDDAEHAVRCGLALLALGKTMSAEVAARHAVPGVDVRIGIHTGSVLLGGGVDAESTIRGSAVNIAARMEQTAPSGALRISHDTYAQVRGLFEVEVQPPLLVKGIAAPIQSYLVVRAKPRSFRISTRGIEGVATRMVGRHEELAVLQDCFGRLFDERTFALATIVADAGVGKSRLLHEFASWAEARPETFFIFRGRATPHTPGQPFGLLRDILAWRFQIADDDGIPAARAKLEAGIVPLFVDDDGPDLAEGHAQLLGHLIGIEYRDSRHIKGILSDPRQIRARALHAASQLFRRVVRHGHSPIVIEIEDLHWADNETLEFIESLSEVNRDVAILVVASTRPGLFERRPDWQLARAPFRRIDLLPLGKQMSEQLVDELLQKLPDVPAVLRDLLIRSAEGNPFYMEELVKMLIDQGAIDSRGTSGDDRWSLHADRLLATRIPTTLTGVLQARLDELPAPDRLTMQSASVVGQTFWDQALIALDDRATHTLPALVKRGLVSRKEAIEAVPEADSLREYGFKHALLHQVTYRTILKRTQRILHGALARWLSSQTGLRANDFLGLIAEHYMLAGDDANAAEYHARAAEHAHSRFAHEQVLKHVEHALPDASIDALPDGSVGLALRWRLLKIREATLDLQARRAEQKIDLDEMNRIADLIDDDALRAHAAWRRSYMSMRTADWAAEEEDARRGVEYAERAGDAALRLRCLRQVALARANMGDLVEGKRLVEDALSSAKTLGLRDIEAACLNALAIMTSGLDDPVEALRINQETLSIYAELGNRLNEAIALSNIGVGWLGIGALEEGGRALTEALRLIRANGDRTMECNTLCTLSELARLQGDNAHSAALSNEAFDIAVSAGARDFEVLALINLGDSELGLGRPAEAIAAFSKASTLAGDTLVMRHDAIAGLARALLDQGDIQGALGCVEPLLATHAAGRAFDGAIFPRLIDHTLHRVLLAAGDSRSRDWIHRAYAALQQTADTIGVEALREGFFLNVPLHRDIASAWRTAGDSDALLPGASRLG